MNRKWFTSSEFLIEDLFRIMLYTKGADTMVMERLRTPQGDDYEVRHLTKNHLDEFSGEGILIALQ